VLFVKKYAGLIVAFAIAAAVIIAWLATSKISGRVSVVIGDTSPVGVPDAHVTLYKVPEEQHQQQLVLTRSYLINTFNAQSG
jgi:hypothetical protein